jgi:hypothetical protein
VPLGHRHWVSAVVAKRTSRNESAPSLRSARYVASEHFQNPILAPDQAHDRYRATELEWGKNLSLLSSLGGGR